ncbi:MAG: polymerase subunit beta [Frankiaceae bacterium]|nr:polymerase subunit beta [Frankiaceae bacterium]MDQ1634635.1 polymerase subunit beta [Frankiaceae bacterium]MDQ1648285.1 polymerase subunit beta [Frankiaceae bacterium]MDQ1673529.1 polymerase subunit beta [Frankiaceae bacterium]
MKFRVERDDLADAVAWVARTLPNRPTTQLQVLAGLLLEAGPAGGLRLSAFDYEVAARGEINATVAEEGRTLVSGRLLAEITRSLPAAAVELAVEGSRAVLTCGSARFTLPTLPVEDYPALPGLPPATGKVGSSAFAAAVGQVAIAAGRDDTLPVLTGVRIEITGERLTLAATDRYRLAVREVPWRPELTDASGTALVPARTLSDAARSMTSAGAEVTLSLGSGPSGEALAGFACGTRETTTRLVDGQFPDYRRLLPPTSPLYAEVEVASLVEAVKRVSLVAARTSPVLLSFAAGELVLEAGAGGEAQAREALPAGFDGPDLSIAFNPGYLLDGLGALESDTVRVGFASADDADEAARKPAIFTGKSADDAPDYRYLLMPVRLAS